MRKKGFSSGYTKIPGEEIKKRHILKTANWFFAHSEHNTMQAILYRIILTPQSHTFKEMIQFLIQEEQEVPEEQNYFLLLQVTVYLKSSL